MTGMAQAPWVPVPGSITLLEIFPPLHLIEISFATNCAISSYCFTVILGKKYGSLSSLITHQAGRNSSMFPS